MARFIPERPYIVSCDWKMQISLIWMSYEVATFALINLLVIEFLQLPVTIDYIFFQNCPIPPPQFDWKVEVSLKCVAIYIYELSYDSENLMMFSIYVTEP